MTLANDTIVAPATAAGGAIAVVRMSGPRALSICDAVFRGAQRIGAAAGHTALFGTIVDGARTLDEVVAAVFRAPRSYTGEDTVEISCHGSRYIIQELLALLIRNGARMAAPGEFTARAFLAGKLDLSQAEAVADLIASGSRASHRVAVDQLRGGYSDEFDRLHDELLRLISLLELELDFGEEEVEFADRNELRRTMLRIAAAIDRLTDSFALGNAIKEGVAVAIVGRPNVGKSTLLNRLLGEQRALVSEIPGTTRDTIEATLNLDGILYRFIDTAGLHETDDTVERMGIERTRAAVAKAHIVMQVVDAADPAAEPIELRPDQRSLLVVNKIDRLGGTGGPYVCPSCDIADASSISAAAYSNDSPATSTVRPRPDRLPTVSDDSSHPIGRSAGHPAADSGRNRPVCHAEPDGLPHEALFISARTGSGMDRLLAALRSAVDTSALEQGDTIVTNSRHREALCRARTALDAALGGLDRLTPDLLSEEIREVAHHLGTITGRITNDEILKTIFAKFCIGK